MSPLFDPHDELRRIKNRWADPSAIELELGTTDAGKPFAIAVRDLSQHAAYFGMSGGGKTRAMWRTFQELARFTDSHQVFFDVMGNSYHFLKRWIYQERLEDRMVLIDPSEDRLICGVNPVAPWPRNHHLQAKTAWDAIRVAIGAGTSDENPLIAEWFRNTLYGLIASGLTMAEAPYLTDFVGDEWRAALIRRLPDERMQHAFARIQKLAKSDTMQAYAQWFREVGAAHRRLEDYAWSPALQLMLGGAVHHIDWDALLDQRKLVLVNLSGVRAEQVDGVWDREENLANEEARLFGLQLISQLIQTCFRRQEAVGDVAPPAYCFVDEVQEFVCPALEQILSRGRQFNLKLLLGVRILEETRDQRRDDDTFAQLVSSIPQFKIVFGGLGKQSAERLAEDLWWHHLDPMEVKDEIVMPIQLQEVLEVEDVTSSIGGHHVDSRGSSFGDAEQFDADSAKQGSGKNAASQELAADGTVWGDAVHRHRQTFPTPPKDHVVSREFWRLDELLHRYQSRLTTLPRQHGVAAVRKDAPVFVRLADVVEPRLTYVEARRRDPELMLALPQYYDPPGLRREEIADRRADFLRLSGPLARDLPASRPRPTPIKPEHRRKEK